MALTDKLSAIANAIRSVNGSTESMTLDEMPVEIKKLSSLDEADVIELIKQQLNIGNFVVIGDEEPENGPVFWFDTSRSTPTDDAVVLILDDYTDEAAVVATIDGKDYAVINANEVVEGDNGYYVLEIT